MFFFNIISFAIFIVILVSISDWLFTLLVNIILRNLKYKLLKRLVRDILKSFSLDNKLLLLNNKLLLKTNVNDAFDHL